MSAKKLENGAALGSQGETCPPAGGPAPGLPRRRPGEPGAGAALGGIGEVFDSLVRELPALDYAQLKELVQSVIDFPATGKRMLLKKFVAGSDPEKALARLALAEYGHKIVDDLNAVVFDVSQSDEVKVRANLLLTELGSPIDRDVLEISVRNADDLAAKSPWHALREAEAGSAAEAVQRLRGTEPKTRAVILHRLAEKDVKKALPLFQQLDLNDEPTAEAVVSALGQFPTQDGVQLLAKLAEAESRSIQKAARKALHSMRTSGFDVPEIETEEEAARAEVKPEKEEAQGPPLFDATVAETGDGKYALVSVAREYANGRLQVLTVAVDFWKKGLRGARYWLDMGKSRYRRNLDERRQSGLTLRGASIDECRKLVARGIRIAREVGTPIPFDIQAGKHLLGDVMAEATQLPAAFVCTKCGQPLPDERVARMKEAAPYDQVIVETRCEKCRTGSAGQT